MQWYTLVTLKENAPLAHIERTDKYMATKKTKTAAGAPAGNSNAGGAPAGAPATGDKMAAARAARAAGGGAQDGDVFTRVVEDKRTDEQKKVKLAPQAQVISNAITAAGAKGITRGDLVKVLGPQGDKPGILVTKQPVGRIVTYYQKDLQAAGVCTLTKATPAAKTPEPAAQATK